MPGFLSCSKMFLNDVQVDDHLFIIFEILVTNNNCSKIPRANVRSRSYNTSFSLITQLLGLLLAFSPYMEIHISPFFPRSSFSTSNSSFIEGQF